MKQPEIIRMLEQKGADKQKIAALVIDNPGILPVLVDVIGTEKGSIKFGCDKIIQMVSEKRPELVYPYFDFFVKMLDTDNKFLKWGAIITIGNLVAVDTEDKFRKIFKKYYGLVTGEVMVSAANVIGKSVAIARAKPGLTEKIVTEILKVEKAVYKSKGEVSPECRNVNCGHAIDTFYALFDMIKKREPVIAFVKRQRKNSRDKVRKKAEKFLNKYKIS